MKDLKKIYFFSLFLIFLFAFYTVYKHTIGFLIPGKTLVVLFSLNFAQRLTALFILPLLAIQLYLGANMVYLRRKFKGALVKLHIYQGIFIYFLILLHTLSFFFYNYFSKHLIDPFYVYTDFCLICDTKQELFLSLGRFAFWGITASIAIALSRSIGWWRDNWRYFHIGNYLLFILVAVHARFSGQDISPRLGGYYYFYLFIVLAVLLLIIYKLSTWFKTNFSLK
jgi:predicted ferric reductase